MIQGATLRFVGLFFLFVLGFTLVFQSAWVDKKIILPYTSFIAAISSEILGFLDIPAQAQGTLIREDRFAVDIRRGCDGVVATILLVSACLAYPFSWKGRVLGTLWGYALIFTADLIRIVGLFIVGLKGSAQTFDFLHVYVSQFVVIALTMVFWIFWAGRQKTVHR